MESAYELGHRIGETRVRSSVHEKPRGSAESFYRISDSARRQQLLDNCRWFTANAINWLAKSKFADITMVEIRLPDGDVKRSMAGIGKPPGTVELEIAVPFEANTRENR